MDALRMDALERYLIDCENKRRRMRDRPSDAVLAELRTLLQRFESVRVRRASSDEGAHEAQQPSA